MRSARQTNVTPSRLILTSQNLLSFVRTPVQFFGAVGEHYNIISELSHQVTMRLKLGQMWDHNGTYIDGLGFRYKDFSVICELDGDRVGARSNQRTG